MTTNNATQPDAPTAELVFFRTETGNRQHLRDCPHLLDASAVRETTPAERATMPVCDMCDRDIKGQGRTPYLTLDDAMRDFQTPVQLQARVRESLAGVTHDEIWLPYSRSYIALGHCGKAVAWAGKHWVQPSRDEFVELPGFVAHGGGRTTQEVRYGATCPICQLTRALNGACDCA
jgi:hypothetical protein